MLLPIIFTMLVHAKDVGFKYKINQGFDDPIEGEPALNANEARNNWKTACNGWKTQTRMINKNNQIVTLNCGSVECEADGSQTVCRSKGNYKIKIKITE